MSNPYQTPQPVPGPHAPSGSQEGDHTGGVIPYKNPYALTAYYLGIFGLLCCITPVPLGILPLVLGIIGLMKRAQNPVIKGSVHAWIGILLGGISAVGSIILAVAVVIGMMNQR